MWHGVDGKVMIAGKKEVERISLCLLERVRMCVVGWELFGENYIYTGEWKAAAEMWKSAGCLLKGSKKRRRGFWWWESTINNSSTNWCCCWKKKKRRKTLFPHRKARASSSRKSYLIFNERTCTRKMDDERAQRVGNFFFFLGVCMLVLWAVGWKQEDGGVRRATSCTQDWNVCIYIVVYEFLIQ